MCLYKQKIVARLLALVLLGVILTAQQVLAEQPATNEQKGESSLQYLLKDPTRLKQDGPLRCLAFSPDGKILAAGASGGYQLWDMKTGKVFGPFVGDKNALSRIAGLGFSPDGKRLASAGPYVKLWDVSTGKLLREIGDGPFFAFSPDRKTLATARAQLWDVATGKMSDAFAKREQQPEKVGPEFVGSRTTVNNRAGPVVFTPNGKTLIAVDNIVTTTTTTRARVMGWAPGEKPIPIPKGGFAGRSIADLARLGFYLETDMEQTYHATVSILDMNSKKGTGSVAAGAVQIYALGVSGDGTILVGHIDTPAPVKAEPRDDDSKGGPSDRGRGGRDREVTGIREHRKGTALCFWDLERQKKLQQFPEATCFAMGHDGRTVAAGFGKKVRILDIATGKTLVETREQPADIIAVALSPDGKTLIAGSADGTILKWQAAK
jgi:WD40 repeat protein